MILQESSVNDGVSYYSSEHSNKTLSPKLTIVYTASETGVTQTASAVAPVLRITGVNGQVTVQGATALSDARILSADGRAMAFTKGTAGDAIVMRLGSAAAGAYVLHGRLADGTAITTAFAMK
jgi:hypothetical protein